jgi:UDP-N-acetylmuramate: L-alanyl-gamma-D-glutamyl-meso-diaminopimelate ligase
MATASVPVAVLYDIDEIIEQVVAQASSGDTIIIMSNGGFGGLHQKLLAQLNTKTGK